MKNYIKALREFVNLIDATGGIGSYDDGTPFPVGVRGCPDLALAYIDAKKALNVAPILLRRTGAEKPEGMRPYDIILQELPDEYRVTRLYTDDLGGYGQGYYCPFFENQVSALLAAVEHYRRHN